MYLVMQPLLESFALTGSMQNINIVFLDFAMIF